MDKICVEGMKQVAASCDLFAGDDGSVDTSGERRAGIKGPATCCLVDTGMTRPFFFIFLIVRN
jgi:hypothetical protein